MPGPERLPPLVLGSPTPDSLLPSAHEVLLWPYAVCLYPVWPLAPGYRMDFSRFLPSNSTPLHPDLLDAFAPTDFTSTPNSPRKTSSTSRASLSLCTDHTSITNGGLSQRRSMPSEQSIPSQAGMPKTSQYFHPTLCMLCRFLMCCWQSLSADCSHSVKLAHALPNFDYALLSVLHHCVGLHITLSTSPSRQSPHVGAVLSSIWDGRSGRECRGWEGLIQITGDDGETG